MNGNDNDERDALAILARLRPGAEQAWTPQEKTAIRQRILATDPKTEPAAGQSLANGSTGFVRVPRPRRKRAAAAALGVAVLIGGSGAAAAGGFMPQAFVDAFPWGSWQQGPAVDPATAERVATAPGPDGTTFTLMAASAADDPAFKCMVALYETRGSAEQPGPATFQDASGNWCQHGPTDRPFEALGVDVADADSYSAVGVKRDTWVWHAAAGKATTAKLRTADGTSHPVLAYNGLLFGWVPTPAAGDPRPVLTGYDASGAIVGQDKL